VNEAISRRKKIRFQYTQFGPDLKETLRGDGEVYELSPYALLWNEDYYYVVGWSDKHQNVSVFRADRLYKPEVLSARAVKKPEGFNLDAYSNRIFEMFDGDPVKVKLECRNDLMKYIVDRFGTKIETEVSSEGTFIVTQLSFREFSSTSTPLLIATAIAGLLCTTECSPNNITFPGAKALIFIIILLLAKDLCKKISKNRKYIKFDSYHYYI
jgi:hypothetical protein